MSKRKRTKCPIKKDLRTPKYRKRVVKDAKKSARSKRPGKKELERETETDA